jgi:hypothetical protein
VPITEGAYNNVDCDGRKRCIIGASGSRPSFVLWGDSHAQALNDALDAAAKRLGVSGYVFYNLGCRPFEDDLVNQECAQNNILVARQLKTLDIKSVFVTARWDAEANQTTPQALLSSLSKTVSAAGTNGAHVYILLDVPRPRQSVPETMQKQFLLHDSADVLRMPKNAYEKQAQAMKAASELLANSGRVTILDPEPVFCGGNSCDVSRQGLPLYNDTEHLNRRGAFLLIDRIIAPVLARCCDASPSG